MNVQNGLFRALKTFQEEQMVRDAKANPVELRGLRFDGRKRVPSDKLLKDAPNYESGRTPKERIVARPSGTAAYTAMCARIKALRGLPLNFEEIVIREMLETQRSLLRKKQDDLRERMAAEFAKREAMGRRRIDQC